jgi:serine/threonine protein kinase
MGCKIESNDDSSSFCIKCGKPMEEIGTKPLQEPVKIKEGENTTPPEEQEPAQFTGIELLDSIWPEWKVVEQIGQGSFGKVYKVIREERGVTDCSAIKVITIPQNNDDVNSLKAERYDETGTYNFFEGVVNNFVNEIKIMVSMKGITNVVSIEDYRVIERTCSLGWDIFIRMELLTSLNDFTANKEMTEEEVIKLGQDICTALELCAKKKIIHRDIKPENIFVSTNDDFKVGDFGIARELEKSNIATSTKYNPNYMAPEVVKSYDYDATVDTYSLGLVLYKLLNNSRLPFIDPSAQVTHSSERQTAIKRRLEGEPLPPPINASSQMFSIIKKACSVNPQFRFKSASDMKAALEKVKEGTYRPEPEKPQKRRAKAVIITIASVFVVAAIVFGGYLWFNSGSGDNEDDGDDPVISGEESDDISSNDDIPELPDSSEEVIAALEAGRYSEAERFANESDEDNLRVLLTSRLESLLTEFRGREVEYSVVQMELEAIGRMNIRNLTNELNSKRNAFEKSNASIVAFDTAEALYNEGAFLAAIEHFNLVDLEEPDFDRALVGVQSATIAYRNQVVSAADNYAESEDFANALNTLNNAVEFLGNDSEINQRVIRFTQDYRAMILRDAEIALNEDGYLSAIQVVRTGLHTLRDDAELLNAIADYDLYAPIFLQELDFFTGNRWIEVYSTTDNLGNSRTNCLNTDRSRTVNVYFINEEFTRMDGHFFQDYDRRNNYLSTTLRIYGDGRLLFSGVMQAGVEPIYFNVDLSGVVELRVEYTRGNANTGRQNALLSDVALWRR